ncbi:MAG: lipoyl synthase [Deltaproteobacteria bacterium]|nr:lipoyl synthase [Deltaproteobacteria bacterium]
MLKKKTANSEQVRAMKVKLRGFNLHTVCEEARCPNLCECFNRGTATFMILGNVCTRSCEFCGVKNSKEQYLKLPASDEPRMVAKMAAELNLRHVVITSVTRDDLQDEGAGQFAATIKAIRDTAAAKVEVLTPDFHAREDCLKTVCEAKPDIFNHNIETVRRLTPLVRSNAHYNRSLEVLARVKKYFPKIRLKSGLMVGLGESTEEVLETLRDLCKVGCNIVTVGQYLAPSKKNLPVREYIKQTVFEEYKRTGESFGINLVVSGPFVRSSYMAADY